MAHHSSEHTTERKDPFLIAMGLLLLICVIAVIIGNQEVFFEVAEKNFQLTAWDVKMIPVGALLFFLFWQFCNAMLFHPYLELVEDRENMTEGATSTATDTIEEAAQLIDEYEAKMTEARVEAMQLKLEALAQAKEQAKTLTDEASVTAAKALEKTRASIREQIAAAKEEAKQQVEALSQEIASKAMEIPTAQVH